MNFDEEKKPEDGAESGDAPASSFCGD